MCQKCMKIKIEQLDFSKDRRYSGGESEYYSRPLMVRVKEHWYSGWRYIADPDTRCPRLFFGTVEEVREQLGSIYFCLARF